MNDFITDYREVITDTNSSTSTDDDDDSVSGIVKSTSGNNH